MPRGRSGPRPRWAANASGSESPQPAPACAAAWRPSSRPAGTRGGRRFYKIGPREAVAARAAGLTILRLAQEAVIAPATHTVEGSAHAGLRRKLRHATKAGVMVRGAGSLPLEAMAEVAADWAARHGGERGLTTGRWSADYVAGQRVFLAEDAEGRLLAFATFHANAQGLGAGPRPLPRRGARRDALPHRPDQVLKR